MLVEYAGLNPMGNKAKAGCPYRNVQATLDGLTSAFFVMLSALCCFPCSSNLSAPRVFFLLHMLQLTFAHARKREQVRV